MRTAPRAPGAIEFAKTKPTLERSIRVVTLLHGGGPVSSEDDHPSAPTRKPDALTPLRGTAIRGQLRFWWRALYGCCEPSVKAMWAREVALWGTAASADPGMRRDPSRVIVRVEGALRPTDVKTETLGNIGQGLRYGAFATMNLTRMSGSVRLVVEVTGNDTENLRREVDDAVTAWLLFGGLGGRTRRGFGAVSLEDPSQLPDPVAFLGRFRHPRPLDFVPTLHRASLHVGPPASDAEEAHKNAVSALRRFRQEINVGRNSGPGRSRWPEADALRRIANTHSADHAPVHKVHAFPRGAFGMPIVFQFKDGKGGDPPTTQLLPIVTALPDGDKLNRMASPLLLRPVWHRGRWCAGALHLPTPGVEALKGRAKSARSEKEVRVALTPQDAEQISPLQAYGGGTDVIAAFLTQNWTQLFPKP